MGWIVWAPAELRNWQNFGIQFYAFLQKAFQLSLIAFLMKSKLGQGRGFFFLNHFLLSSQKPWSTVNTLFHSFQEKPVCSKPSELGCCNSCSQKDGLSSWVDAFENNSCWCLRERNGKVFFKLTYASFKLSSLDLFFSNFILP